MTGAGMSHSYLAAKLVVEGALANIAGNVQGKMPIESIVLTELERTDIKLAQGGTTLFFPLPPTGVFFDMHGPRATVWFTENDFSRGLETVEAAMKQAFPKTKQIKDAASPTEKNVRLRSFEVDLGNKRMAHVEIEHGAANSEAKKFVVRITAQTRKG